MIKEFVRFPESPIAFDGWYIILSGLLAALCFWAGFFVTHTHRGYLRPVLGTLGMVAILFSVFSVWFFRDPPRAPEPLSASGPLDARSVLSAADGTVLKVDRVEHIDDSDDVANAERISIFMSPLNVHVNRAPVEGTIARVHYIPGKFFAANLDKASKDNERNWVTIETPSGLKVSFLQIAGFIARRIVCNIRPGDHLARGQRYGMIRFGSRMEIYLPTGSQIFVKPGDFVHAGQTIVGKLPG
jgi:phosphatidylserine decarboxylase